MADDTRWIGPQVPQLPPHPMPPPNAVIPQPVNLNQNFGQPGGLQLPAMPQAPFNAGQQVNPITGVAPDEIDSFLHSRGFPALGDIGTLYPLEDGFHGQMDLAEARSREAEARLSFENSYGRPPSSLRELRRHWRSTTRDVPAGQLPQGQNLLGGIPPGSVEDQRSFEGMLETHQSMPEFTGNPDWPNPPLDPPPPNPMGGLQAFPPAAAPGAGQGHEVDPFDIGMGSPQTMAPYSPAPGVFQSPPGFGNFGLQTVLRPENEIRAQMYGATG